ncbi:transcriptional regulator, TetR family [Meinhardsimonia xiamenensis]|jgi:AcrR family transcriptional regulator|uniref:Transcriptional regulator, TetR family n=1 Tax=Meinhardsimonia xiamenensis TaxID=990712 RepID=A0A1G9DAP2_9RHOB|nr:TetR/AcrR family transcriptional regulator [Meinhardsimonia xiamenensis]PRX38070.1 TetR family transcriptional regulator [Meinhardsimonia xiamenensis]SDK60855.1 transcriptional regulator, TetR family [Meinhardsimonia xiamenensis]
MDTTTGPKEKEVEPAEGGADGAPARRDPEGVRRDILAAAGEVFAERGLSGARIDEIAARTRTSKRMIYYYFGDKEGLYRACLEAAYDEVRRGEEALDLGGLPPAEALARLVAFTFDHHRRHPAFIRMVMIENIHRAAHLRASRVAAERNRAAVARLTEILRRGEAEGVFRPGVDPLELHWHISALSFFNVSNRPTFSALFGDELFSEEAQARLRAHAVEMILALVRQEEPGDDDQA